MKVIITGGAGFLGNRLARSLLLKGELTHKGSLCPIEELVLFDMFAPSRESLDELNTIAAKQKTKMTVVTGALSDQNSLERIIDTDALSVFHLASIMSGEGEVDFDKCMEVNLDGTRALMDIVRRRNCPDIKFLFTSSIATFTVPESGIVNEFAKPEPTTTYGMTKAVCEMMVNDYSRRNFLDGRSARLPTVIVRPGKPNKAASSCFSAVFREPLSGIDYEVPVDPSTVHPCAGYRSVVENIVAIHEIKAEDLGPNRTVGIPAMAVSVQEMIGTVNQYVTDSQRKGTGKITIKIDPSIADIVKGWPKGVETPRADDFGLKKDQSLRQLLEEYVEDFGSA